MGKTGRTKQRYTQKFRREWLKDDRFRDWIAEVSSDSARAACRALCRCESVAKNADLVSQPQRENIFLRLNVSLRRDKLISHFL